MSKRLADSGVVARDTRLRSQLDTLSTELTELGVSSAVSSLRQHFGLHRADPSLFFAL